MTTATHDSTDLQKLGDMMFALGKELFPRGYVKDVYTWEDGQLSFAWVMAPEKLRRAIPYGEGPDYLPFSGPHVTRALKGVGIKYAPFDYERNLDVNTFLEHVANSLWDVFPDADGFHATFIPEPGYPWPNEYYSAKKRSMVDGSVRPPWLLPENVIDPGMDIDSPGVDFCELIGPLKGYQMGAEIATWSEWFGAGTFRQKMDWKAPAYFIVTHAMGTMEDMTRHGSWAENAKHVNSCGGLLFPSLAVGAIPATNFGPFILVADVGLVVRSLNPNRKSGHLPAYVYDTDVWSMTTGTFYKEGAVSAFEQLTGMSEWMYYLDMNIWPLGTPQAPELHGPGVGSRLKNVGKLMREVKSRADAYSRGLMPEEMQEVFESVADTKARYPYLEAKANGVMPMSSFPMAVAPEQAGDGFRGFLDETGFRGRLLTVELPQEVAEVMDPAWSPPGMDWERRNAFRTWAQMQYGWHVADAVREAGRELEI